MDSKTCQLKNQPNYKKLYQDLIKAKYPEKMSECEKYFQKNELLSYDVIAINKIIADNSRKISNKYKSYDKETIIKILLYQKEKELNNKQTADHFGISRNSVIKWKKLYSHI